MYVGEVAVKLVMRITAVSTDNVETNSVRKTSSNIVYISVTQMHLVNYLSCLAVIITTIILRNI